jgi:pimeloyl-ACP methyl ester carboxylesterase
MAKATETSRVTRPSVGQHTAQPWKYAVLLIALGVAALAAFYGIGGWYFSNEIYEAAFQVNPPGDDSFDITFDRGEAESVVLRGDDGSANLFENGRFGLAWESGTSLVDGILRTETAGGRSIVYRQRVAGEEIPAPGSAVLLDPFIWPGDPKTALDMSFEEVSFPIEGGRAGAWYVEGTTNTWTIFVHGKGAPRNEALRLLPLAVERGYHGMVIDYRNDPGAPADPSGIYQYGLTEWQDVAAAGRYALSNGADALVFIGYSMGGANVMSYALQSPLRNHTIAIILDSPVLDLESAVDHAAAQRTLPLLPTAVPPGLVDVAKSITSWRFDVDWDATDYVSRWRDLHTPTLILQGTDDTTVQIEPAEDLARIRSDIVSLIELPGVGHAVGWNADPSGYEASVNAFLDGAGA